MDHTLINQIGNLLIADIEIPDEVITAGGYQFIVYELPILREDGLESIIVVFTDLTNNSLTVPQYTVDDILYFVST